MVEIKDIIKEACVIGEEATFEEALRAMVDSQTNTLLVTNEEGQLSGEVSVSDLLDAIVPANLDGDHVIDQFGSEKDFGQAIVDAKDTPVAEFMTADFDTVRPDDGLLSIASTAIAYGRARIPVVDHDNRPIGIISRRGLKHILASFLGIKDKA